MDISERSKKSSNNKGIYSIILALKLREIAPVDDPAQLAAALRKITGTSEEEPKVPREVFVLAVAKCLGLGLEEWRRAIEEVDMDRDGIVDCHDLSTFISFYFWAGGIFFFWCDIWGYTRTLNAPPSLIT